MLFETLKTPAGQHLTLAQYVEAMPEGQKDILYLIGESREQLENSPYLESARAAGHDVLLLTDPVDEFFVQGLGRYKEKTLTAVDRATPAGEVDAAQKERYAKLLDTLKAKLPEVAEVRLSTRLKDSAVCLVAAEHGMSAHLERLMARHGREVGENKRVLEINGSHPLLEKMLALPGEDPRLEGTPVCCTIRPSSPRDRG